MSVNLAGVASTMDVSWFGKRHFVARDALLQYVPFVTCVSPRKLSRVTAAVEKTRLVCFDKEKCGCATRNAPLTSSQSALCVFAWFRVGEIVLAMLLSLTNGGWRCFTSLSWVLQWNACAILLEPAVRMENQVGTIQRCGDQVVV